MWTVWKTETTLYIIAIIAKIDQILDYIPELTELSPHTQFLTYFMYEEVKAAKNQLPRPTHR